MTTTNSLGHWALSLLLLLSFGCNGGGSAPTTTESVADAGPQSASLRVTLLQAQPLSSIVGALPPRVSVLEIGFVEQGSDAHNRLLTVHLPSPSRDTDAMADAYAVALKRHAALMTRLWTDPEDSERNDYFKSRLDDLQRWIDTSRSVDELIVSNMVLVGSSSDLKGVSSAAFAPEREE